MYMVIENKANVIVLVQVKSKKQKNCKKWVISYIFT